MLRDEANKLAPDERFIFESETYSHGYCFDNCPSLVQTFSVTGERGALSQQLQDKLAANGYAVDPSNSGNILADKDKPAVSVTVNFLPPISGRSNPPVTKVELIFYNQ